MFDPQSEAFARAHARLAAATTLANWQNDPEDPNDPDTIWAMQLVLEIPKINPPRRNDLLIASAQAVVALCLDELAGMDPIQPESFAAALDRWYHLRIRKVSRRARNTAWSAVQLLPGVTIEHNGAKARAFVPTAVNQVPAPIRKLQIGGTDLAADHNESVETQAATIYINAAEEMTVGKAAAQVGHASMLLAGSLSLPQVQAWAETGFKLEVRYVDNFAELIDDPSMVVVRDAGFTEVAPGTATVAANWKPVVEAPQ